MKLISNLLIAATMSLPAFANAEGWQKIVSKDGKVSALAPGKTRESDQTRSVLGHKFVTHVTRYETKSVVFDLAYTPVKKRFVDFGGKDRIANNAKGKILDQAMGRQKVFKQTSIDGAKVHYLEYEMPNPKDPKGPLLLGYSLIYVADDGIYVANGVVVSGSGDADLDKFAKSISIRE